MAAQTFTDLKTRWQGALATDDDDADFMANLASLISDAELMCIRALDPLAARKVNQALSYTAGVNSVALPSDCVIPKRITCMNGTVRSTLEQRQLSFLDEYWSDHTATGTPRYWAMPVDQVVQIAPTPTSGFTLRLDYTYLPATLSEANPSTWLSTHYPDLLHAAGMLGLASWTKNYGTRADDGGMVGHWEQRFAMLLADARRQEALKKGEPPMEVGPTAPVPASGG